MGVVLQKDILCQVLLKLAQWFWRIRFSNIVNVFSLCRYYLPLEIGVAFIGCFVSSLVKIVSMVQENKILLQCIFAISLLSFLRNKRGPSFE